MHSASSSRVKIFSPPFSRNELVGLLRARVRSLAMVLPLKRVVLFGSWAKGRATAFSDVDLLVIYEDPSRGDAYNIVWKCLEIRALEPHVYSESEAREQTKTLERMVDGGVTIYSKGGGGRGREQVGTP